MKFTIPNCLTMLRIIGAAILVFVAPFTPLFFVLYSITGVTDALDGAIARATKTDSPQGARLDSIADMLFYAVMLLKVFPVLLIRLPSGIWLLTAAALLIRITAYLIAAVKYRKFASLHTWLNKLTGLLVFAVPYLVLLPFAVPACYVVAIVAAISSLEEMTIHIRSSEYPQAFQ